MDMARKKRGEVKRLPVELDLSDPAQRRVWEYWVELSEQGKASEWVRQLMINNVPAKPKPKQTFGKVPASNNGTREPRYEPIDE
jgi:hypothetical protein